MRIVATADLHYNILRSQEPARRIAGEICGLDADVLLVLGDVASRDPQIILDGLRLFDRFPGLKLFVAGNHDIWTLPGGDSLARLERELPDICHQAGFHPLDREPVIMDDVGLVGSMGWYDYSFRPRHLGIPMRFYENKIAPGAAERIAAYKHLVNDRSDIPEKAFNIGTHWMDGEYVQLPMSDVEFCKYLLARFKDHLDQAAGRPRRIIVGMHHLPFHEMVPPNDNPSWAFGMAFLGSALFGEAMLACPRISHVLCGHTHKHDRIRRDHIDCINIGSTYIEKRYEVIEIPEKA